MNKLKTVMLIVVIALTPVGGAQTTGKSAPAKPKVFNIKTYGAIGDGVAMETRAIQKTIDACHAAGGGVVRVPAGDFQIGTIHLKSNVTLSLDYGASLLGSQNWADYPTDKLRRAREGANRNACSMPRMRPTSGLRVLASLMAGGRLRPFRDAGLAEAETVVHDCSASRAARI